MNAALAGYAVGLFLAAGGVGYLFVGLLIGIRVYRRWPRLSHVLASMFVLVVGFFTAMSAGSDAEFVSAIVATLCAAAVVAFYRSPITKAQAS